jgi:hypothetical protein
MGASLMPPNLTAGWRTPADRSPRQSRVSHLRRLRMRRFSRRWPPRRVGAAGGAGAKRRQRPARKRREQRLGQRLGQRGRHSLRAGPTRTTLWHAGACGWSVMDAARALLCDDLAWAPRSCLLTSPQGGGPLRTEALARTGWSIYASRGRAASTGAGPKAGSAQPGAPGQSGGCGQRASNGG